MIWVLGGGFKYFYFYPYLGKIPILTNIFQRGWNHQLVIVKQSPNFVKEPLLLSFFRGGGVTFSCHDGFRYLDNSRYLSTSQRTQNIKNVLKYHASQFQIIQQPVGIVNRGLIWSFTYSKLQEIYIDLIVFPAFWVPKSSFLVNMGCLLMSFCLGRLFFWNNMGKAVKNRKRRSLNLLQAWLGVLGRVSLLSFVGSGVGLTVWEFRSLENYGVLYGFLFA